MIDEGIELPSLSVESKECLSCGCIKPMNHFRRDATITDGRSMQCEICQDTPRLSTSEHVARLRERNIGTEAVKRQRWAHQDDYRDFYARLGRQMHAYEFLRRLQKIVGPNGLKLFWMDGRILGDLALFKMLRTQPEYLMYIPTLYHMPEYSQYEFDDKDILVRESKRGWRTVLLRLIKSEIIAEQQVDREFGVVYGPASTVWRRQLFIYRNGHE